MEIDKIYNCDCLEDEVSPDNTGETTDGKGKIRPELQKKIDFAIRLLKAYDNPEHPIEIAYSGGKDSDVILQLAKEAGVNFRAIYKNTTIDPPGTIKHAEEMGVEIIRPKQTFFQLIEECGLPNRNYRFCCNVLKEYKVLDKQVQGRRKCESRSRKERYHEPSACRLYSKDEHVELVYPILEWTDKDVAEFIADRNIKCAPVYYDESGKFHVERRLGCLGCPLASKNKRIKQFKQYPGIFRQWVKRLRKFRATHPDAKVVTKYDYADEYEQIFRDIFCTSQSEFEYLRGGLFGKPDFKAFLEKQFGISLG